MKKVIPKFDLNIRSLQSVLVPFVLLKSIHLFKNTNSVNLYASVNESLENLYPTEQVESIISGLLTDDRFTVKLPVIVSNLKYFSDREWVSKNKSGEYSLTPSGDEMLLIWEALLLRVDELIEFSVRKHRQ